MNTPRPNLSQYCTDDFLRPHVVKIEQQSTWTDTDVDKLISWCSALNYVTGQHELSFAAFVALAPDVRIPANKATRLQELIAKLEKSTADQTGLSLVVNAPECSLAKSSTQLRELLAGIATGKAPTFNQIQVAKDLLYQMELGAEMVSESAKVYCNSDHRPGERLDTINGGNDE